MPLNHVIIKLISLIIYKYSSNYVFGKVNALAKQGLNICIIGEFGSGKSYLLQELAGYYGTTLLDSNPSIEALMQILNKKCSSKKEAYNRLLRKKKQVLLFDDVHESRKDTISIILKLCRRHTIIVSSEKEIERLKYDFQTVKLERWKNEDCIKLCKNLGIKGKAAEKISKNSGGLPLLIIRGIEYYKVTGETRRYFYSDWKKGLVKKLVIFAYICLSIRYLAKFTANSWELYSLFSITGHLLLAFNKYNRKL